MALNISEASAVNTLTRYLRGEQLPATPITHATAQAALAELLDSAHKKLAAGLLPEHAKGWREPESDEQLRERVIDALRDAHRNDSAADAVEFVSRVVGWDADTDAELLAEREANA